MRSWTVIAATLTAVVPSLMVALPAPQNSVRPVDEKILGEYAGVYRWQDKGFIYLQIWSELSGKNELVAFDESGQVRTLYPTEGDGFFTGPGGRRGRHSDDFDPLWTEMTKLHREHPGATW